MKLRSRNMLLLSALCIVLLGCSPKKNSLMRANLKGNVKTLTEKEYDAVSQPGGPEKTGFNRRTVFSFNNEGNCTETDGYTPTGMLVMKSVTKFDAKGHKTNQETFDGNGNKLNNNTYAYDNSGNMTEAFFFGPNGENQGKMIFKYDAKDRNIEEKLANGAGEVTYRKEQRYNDKGDASEETEYAPDGSVEHRYSFTYANDDPKGNWQRKTTLQNGKTIMVTDREIVYW